MNIRFFVTVIAFIAAVNIEIFGQGAILLGVRDNEYARIGFLDKRKWYVMAEHSVFVTKLKNQVINGYAGYKGN